jgi:hypothetical protein
LIETRTIEKREQKNNQTKGKKFEQTRTHKTEVN